MWKLILENPYYTEVFAKALLIFIPVCIVITGIVLFKVLCRIFKLVWWNLRYLFSR